MTDLPDLSIADASITEGNSGTKLLTFTVSLSAASADPVTFDIATADGTATAGSDYVAASATGETIPAGQTSKTFSVTLNGDAVVEGDETFVVDVSNVSGADVTFHVWPGAHEGPYWDWHFKNYLEFYADACS